MVRIPPARDVWVMKGTPTVSEQEDIIDRAIGWHVRLAEASEQDWADFIAWMEADPAHAEAYDRVALDDRLIEHDRFPAAEPVAANDNPSRRGRWLWPLSGTAAAAAIVAVLAPSMLSQGPAPYSVATAAGESRTVTLADGTSIEMNGDTALRLDRNNPRVAMLDKGEAVFRVRHDAANPFTLTTGAVTVRDLGTVFDVSRQDGGVSVAVAEGSVMFQPERDALTLRAGDMLSANSDGGDISRSRVAPDQVGSWRTGTLSFTGQRVADVAAAIRRRYGLDLSVEGTLSDRPFTGMIHLTGAADRDVPHLAGLIGARWRIDGRKWILSGGETVAH
jgi:transmembrane sensor